MQTKVFITILLLSVNILAGSAQNDFFSKLSDNQNITSVTITKALLNATPAYIEGVEISKLIDKLDRIDVYNSDNREASRQMKTMVGTYMAKDSIYELLMKIKDGTENVTFYAEKNNDAFKSLIMIVEDAPKYTLIRLIGNFTAKDIERVIKDDEAERKSRKQTYPTYGGTIITRQTLEQTSETNLLRAVAMKAAGVEYQNGNLVIRGINSLNLSYNPLYVINGVQAYDASYLTVQEVESVEILKGADASMFGVKGSNGVIIINLR